MPTPENPNYSAGISIQNKFAQRPILCYVSDRKELKKSALRGQHRSREALLERINAAHEAGIDWIQLREKDLSGKDCASLAHDAFQLTKVMSSATQHVHGINQNVPHHGPTSTLILINDRVDVAIAEQAGGVHLTEKSLPPKEVRRWIKERLARTPQFAKEDFLIGVSCHSIEAAQSAADSGADYIFFGPVFATPSKTAFGAPQGLGRLAQVCRVVKIPVLAIGGITRDNAASCIAAGAAGIAAIRLFQDAADLPSLVSELKANTS